MASDVPFRPGGSPAAAGFGRGSAPVAIRPGPGRPPPVPAGVNAPQPGHVAQRQPAPTSALAAPVVPVRRAPPPVPAGVNAPQPGHALQRRPGPAPAQAAPVAPARRPAPAVPAGVNAPQPGQVTQRRPAPTSAQAAPVVPVRRAPPPVPAGVNAPQPGRVAQRRPAPAPAQPAPVASVRRAPPPVPAGVNAPQPGGGNAQRAAVQPAESRPVRPAGPASRLGAPSAAQLYRVLDSSKIYGQMPTTRPWFGYPYVVVNDARFIAQEKQGGMRAVDEFLQSPGGLTAYVKKHSMNGLSVRLSDDNNMAIEDSNLTNRQPKSFYATQELLTSANQALTKVGSGVKLNQGKRTLTVLTGWYTSKTLVEVYPRFLKSKGYNYGQLDQVVGPQNCNEIAEMVTGIRKILPTGDDTHLKAVNRFLNSDDDFADIDNARTQTYVAYLNSRATRLSRLRANRFATPDIGDAYMIRTLGEPSEFLSGGRARIRDYASGTDRILGWAEHFAGVVVRSGNDTLTLENYARGDNRQANPDPRWYFQMYGQNHGQSFHEFHSAKNEYANPVTVSVGKTVPNLPKLGPLQ